MHSRLNGVFSHQVGFPASAAAPPNIVSTARRRISSSSRRSLKYLGTARRRLCGSNGPAGQSACPDPAAGTDSSNVLATSSGHSRPTASQ